MSSCINQNSPEFKNLVTNTTDSEKVIAAVVNIWQENNGVDTIPSVKEYEDYKIQIQVQDSANMSYEYFEKLAQNLNDNWSETKTENVTRLLNSFKNSIIDTTEGANTEFPRLALQKLLNSAERGAITPEYIAESIEYLNMYLHRSNMYLEGMVKGLRTFLGSQASTRNKVAALFSAYQTADNFKRQLKSIFPEDEDFRSLVDNYKGKGFEQLFATKKSMENSIADLTNIYESKLSKQVADELWSLFGPNAEAVNKEAFGKQIEFLEKQLAETKSPSQRRLLETKLKREQESFKKNALTRANLERWINNPTGSWYALIFKSGSYNADPGVQVISKYIYNIVEDAQREFFQKMNRLQDIMERIQTLAGENLDIRNMYKGLYRETVDQFGNFALVLQTQMKDQELRNERFKLKEAIDKAENEEDRQKAIDALKLFSETYEERKFIDDYYEFRKILPEDIKQKIDELRDEKNTIIARLDGISISEGDLEAIKAIDKTIKDLSKEYDDFGNLKSPEEVRVAQLLQAYNKRAQELGVHDFYLENSSKLQFEATLKEQEEKLNKILNGPGTAVEKEAAQDEFARWLSYYSRDTFAPEYYTKIKKVTDKIDAITSKYEETTIGKNNKKIRTLLQGYRDANGVYDGTEVSTDLTNTIRTLEEEIEAFKTTKGTSKMTLEDKAALGRLINELQELQYTGATEYYKTEVENRKNLIRSQLLKNQEWDDGDILNAEVERKFEDSQWFQDNHIYVERYIDGKLQLIPRPIAIWRRTVPSDYAIDTIKQEANALADRLEQQDPVANKERIKELRALKVVQERVPSRVWFSYRVNPKLENPNYSRDINFKVVKGAFYNNEWDTLSPEKKSIAKDLLDFYLEEQKDQYSQNKLRTILPYHRKEGLELSLDTVALKRKGVVKNAINELKTAFRKQDFQNPDVDDVYGEVDQQDAFGNPLEKAGKVLYMRYARPLDKGVMSYDIMKGIGLYIGEATKFSALRENQNTILGAQAIAERRTINSGTKTTEGIINRVLYGENMKNYDSNVANRISALFNFTLKRSGAMSLGQNLSSPVKNLVAGMAQNFILAGNYDITLADLHAARVEAALASKDWLLNPQVGNRPLNLQILDNFGAIQQRDFGQGAFIKSTFLRKFGNIFKMVNRFREWTEFEVQATLAFAIMNKVYVKGPNGTQAKLMDAYALQGNNLVIKPGYEVPDHLVRAVRAKIKHMNHHSQGLYDQLYQPEGTKYVIYRILFYMGKWKAPKIERYFGSEYVDYLAGVRSKGAYKVLWQFVVDVAKYQKNFIAAYQTLTPTEKKQIAPIWRTTVLTASYMVLQALLKDCDDDGDQDACDYANWLAKGVGDELESLDPIMTPINFTYGFVDQKTQISAPERVVNQLISPLTRMWNIFSDPAIRFFDPMEPYYKRNSAGKIDWNTTDPLYGGKPAIAVLALKLSGFGELDVSPRRMEYKSRSFTHFNPKLYTEKTETRYISEEGSVKKIESESEKEERKEKKEKNRESMEVAGVKTKKKKTSFQERMKSKRAKKSSLFKKAKSKKKRD
jgi:hypothetical protein